jgi:hypothetical protein
MKMNKISIAVLIALGSVFSSCEKQLAEIQPRSSINPDVISSAQDVEKLLLGVYDAHQSGGSSASFNYLSFLTEDLSADNLEYRATFFQHGEIDNNAILANNVLVQRFYIFPYVVIYRANEVLRVVEQVEFADSRKQEVIGEAAYLRALAYYRLATLFGGVPVLTANTTEGIPRNTEEETWARIIADLETAVTNAPAEAANRNYVSSNAAKALLARVMLIRKDYDRAQQLAEEVINSGKYNLTSDYRSIYTQGVGAVEEVIFQLKNTELEGQAYHGFFLLDQGQYNPFGTGGRLELPVDPSLLEAYEEGDVRKEASVAPARPRPTGGNYYQVIKYPGGSIANDPFYISRVSEMYLISAEAAAEKAQNPIAGLERLNEVREKRGLGSVVALTMEDFRDKVLHERRVEFAFEGLRWTDLKRTGRAIEVLPKVTNANQLLYPIPTSERDVNPNLSQNDGY